MMSIADNVESWLQLLQQAAQRYILPEFARIDASTIRSKSNDDDIVTDADLAAERFISETLQKMHPEALIIGEEAVYARPELLALLPEAELAFIIDPIDGTWNFAHGLPVFGCMLAVTRLGETVAGMIYYPLSQQFLLAQRGQGAWLRDTQSGQETPVWVTPAPVGCQQMSGFIAMSQFSAERQKQFSSRLTEFARVSSLRCSAYEYRLMCQGSVHFTLNAELHPWDHAAGQLIHREAGGYSALLDGRGYQPTINQGHLLLAPDRESWQQIKSTLMEGM